MLDPFNLPLCSDSLRTFEFNFQAFLCNINESWNFHLITFLHLQGKRQIPRCLGSKQELMTLRWESFFSNWFSKTLQWTFAPKIHNYALLWYACWKSRLRICSLCLPVTPPLRYSLRRHTRSGNMSYEWASPTDISYLLSFIFKPVIQWSRLSEVCCCQERFGCCFFFSRLWKRSLTREEREQQQAEKH